MEILESKDDCGSEATTGNVNSGSEFLHVARAGSILHNNGGRTLEDSLYAGTECSSDAAARFDPIETDEFDKDRSARLAYDNDVSIRERSLSFILGNNAFCDGPSSDDCANRLILGDEREGVTFYPDYIDHHGTHYLESVVIFSRSCVEVRNKTAYATRGTFHIVLEIDDIVRIESHWSARVGTVDVYFIPKDSESNATGMHELKFPVVDCNWYEKLEAIESLDSKYRALLCVALE
ncbi:hypothetical protein M569_13952 [Genlisea aurea]|uniref:Probable ubiquitin-like-specific protease 2A/B PH domain-containing protein n=1 Tax=Genlisea aurea TaxID=192259 RepID=S8C2H3_9LAMI|nr:hypothetical protein M569_13952 [Genlisea aurea]